MAFSMSGMSGAVGGASPQARQAEDLLDIQTEHLGFAAIAGRNTKTKITNKLKLLPSPWRADDLPPSQANLFTTAPRRGVVAAAGPDCLVIASADSIRAALTSERDEANKDPVVPFTPELTIPLPRLSQVAFTSDEQLLVISAQQGGGLAIHEVGALLQKNTNSAFQLATQGMGVRALVPNPAPELAEHVAMVTEKGQLMIANLKQRDFVKTQNGAVLKDNGKQLVAGLADGTIVQMKPDGSPTALIPRPPALEGDQYVATIAWLTNDDFFTVHAPASIEPGSPPEMTYHIINREKGTQNYTFNKFILAACDGFGEIRNSPPHYFVSRLRNWKPSLDDLVLVSSTGGMELGIITKSSQPLSRETPITNAYIPTVMADDARKASMPGTVDEDAYPDMPDSSPLGLAVDLSSKDKVYKPISGSDIEWSKTPLPAVLVLNQEGYLNAWWIVYNASVEAGTAYEGLAAAGGAQSAPAPQQAQPAAARSSSPFGKPAGGAFGQPAFGSSGFGNASPMGQNKSPWASASTSSPTTPQPQTQESDMGDADDANGDATPSETAKPGGFGLGASGFKLDSAFKGDGTAKDDLPKPEAGSSFGSFGLGSSFGQALGEAQKTEQKTDPKTPNKSGFSLFGNAGNKAQEATASTSPKDPAKTGGGLFGFSKSTSPFASAGSAFGKPVEKAKSPAPEVTPEVPKKDPKPEAAPLPPDFIKRPAKKDDFQPEDAPLPPDFTLPKAKKDEREEEDLPPIAGSPPDPVFKDLGDDQEFEATRAILSSSPRATKTLEEFYVHQDYAGRSGPSSVPGSIEQLYRDMQSMIDTVGLNAHHLAGFIKGHNEITHEGRSRDDLDVDVDDLEDNDWVLAEIEDLSKVENSLERSLDSGRVTDVQNKIRDLIRLSKDVGQLRRRLNDVRKSIEQRRDPSKLAVTRATPLSEEQGAQQAQLRSSFAQTQKLLAQAEEGIILLKTRISSAQATRPGGATSGAPSQTPTVENVEKTIRKMTTLVEQKSGELDVLDSKLRKLRLVADDNDSEFPADGRAEDDDDIAAGLGAMSLRSSGRFSREASPAVFATPPSGRRYGPRSREGTPFSAGGSTSRKLFFTPDRYGSPSPGLRSSVGPGTELVLRSVEDAAFGGEHLVGREEVRVYVRKVEKKKVVKENMRQAIAKRGPRVTRVAGGH
ncbi:putative nuclear pore complex subunit nup159 protein [Neofusicoccum parvum UCRNP2]|uniref:Putative nuclear pore complex subunit nup159 protein n=1 Tax=Botryosphaeria parva (strain UCR-NP2) TaxID=1287680 RepID=R1EK15_BOTPV|nr:putative nuclear pore complex subunit nup159 protein [Neofusicoccum parvum UCRNP2]